jgi:Ca-activated chloride channel homolog
MMKKLTATVMVWAIALLLVTSLPGCATSDDGSASGDSAASSSVDVVGNDTSSTAGQETSSPYATVDAYASYDSSAKDTSSYTYDDCSAETSPSLPGEDDDYQDGEQYGQYIENDFILTSEEATSTFSVDVDTGSYTIMRRDLNLGELPHKDSVRVEEYINYFRYDYPNPVDQPFSINMEVAPSPFGERLHLLRVGLKGYVVPEEERLDANLVFLIDVSGSMSSSNKLPLVKFMLKKLVAELRPTDTLGIVVYAGQDAVLLDPTPVNDADQIISAINSLGAGGSTAGAAGLVSAYQMAAGHMLDGGINRVILCTDGDFNVGTSGQGLIPLIEEYRETGVSLSVFSFGSGNLQDGYMEQLADHGNGNYAYIDSEDEASHIVDTKLIAILQTIAKDVKVQIVFNPANVLQYRLVGYENRLLNNEDFEDDTVDAAEIGSGHTVTAFYEIELAEEQNAETLTECRFRYKAPQGSTSMLITQDVFAEEIKTDFATASDGFRFAAAVVEFAEILRRSKHSSDARFEEVMSIASGALNPEHPEALEFVSLIEIAEGLWP